VKPTSTVNKPKPNAKGKDAGWYRTQISKLQAQIPPLDEKISQLQAALNGQTVTSTRQYGGTKPDDWRDELSRFQKQRDDIDTKIAALEDQARHDGVPENELP
jgi:chaperonin cofactor prefoldin